jgi:predicted MFS family arabinose efflux permease
VSWRLIFYINLPIAVAVVAIAARHVPESRDAAARGRVDFPGAMLVTVGLVGLTFSLIEGPALGWSSPAVLGALAGRVTVLAVFARHERRASNPMLPVDIFASGQFTAANAVTFIVYGALGGALFLLPIQLQQVSEYTPLQADVALLPVTVIMLALSARSGALAARIGPRLQMSIGPVLIGAGLALAACIGPADSYLTEVLPVACWSSGSGLPPPSPRSPQPPSPLHPTDAPASRPPSIMTLPAPPG